MYTPIPANHPAFTRIIPRLIAKSRILLLNSRFLHMKNKQNKRRFAKLKRLARETYREPYRDQLHLSVLSRVILKQPKVFSLGCLCHLAALCAAAALKKLPVSIDNL